MNCPSCNTPNRDDAKFCKSCGRPLSPAGTSSASIPSSPEDAQSSSAVGTLTDQTSTTSASPQGNTKPVLVQENTSDVGDIATEPTLVLSPDQMESYRRRWQEGTEQDNQGTPSADLPAPNALATSVVTREQQSTNIAEMPTLVTTPTDNNVGALSGEEVGAHFNTLRTQNNAPQDETPLPQSSASANEELIPSPPPETGNPVTPTGTTQNGEPETLGAGFIAPNTATNAASSDVSNTPATDTSANASENTPTNATSNAPVNADQAPPTADFPVLPIGTTLAARYEITQILEEIPQEHTYLVTDHQGYQHCWNCGSEDNVTGDEFCSNCGAELLGQSYIMHEYPATATSREEDAPVLQGNIVNTFVERGQTYMIEQPNTAQNAFPNGVQLLAACNSDAGNVRRSEPNEDCTLVLLLQRVFESVAAPAGIFIVADGMGGHDNGQVASRTTINIIAERMLRDLLTAPLTAERNGESTKPFDEETVESLFRSAIEEANATLVQINQRNKTDMGTTITGFLIVGDHSYIINVGDSRTYMLRGKQLYQVTTDHSLVGQLVASGLIEPEDVYTHPQRSQIFRSLGDKPNVQVDLFKQQLQPGDILLSCSDGLWEMVRNPQIERILNEASDPQTACSQLIDAANANGGEDNVSAVIVVVR